MIKHIESNADSKERDVTLGYFPSLKYALSWLKCEKIKSLGTLTIDEYINELRKLESWTGGILNEQKKQKAKRV